MRIYAEFSHQEVEVHGARVIPQQISAKQETRAWDHLKIDSFNQ